MKNLILFTFLLATQIVFSQNNNNLPPTYPLKKIVNIINNSLDQATLKLENKPIQIKGAEIELSTTYDATTGGEFKLFVKASQKWQLEKVNKMKFTYEKPSESKIKTDQKNTGTVYVFEVNLTNAIVDAANQWINTTDTVTGLKKSDFSVEISFMVKSISALGVEFEIWGIGADVGAEYENSVVHTITLTFQ